jgi:hypothetical protein
MRGTLSAFCLDSHVLEVYTNFKVPMKTLRFILTVSLLTSLIVPQTSTVAHCQMNMGLISMACPMPCCKTTPMPATCQIRQTSVRDVIAPSVRQFHTMLQVVFTLAQNPLTKPLTSITYLKQFTTFTASLLRTSTSLVRAPPAEYIQFSA